jgi:hypothetical protein
LVIWQYVKAMRVKSRQKQVILLPCCLKINAKCLSHSE